MTTTLALMRSICDAAQAAGISAIIASDVAVLAYCRRIGMEVHLSTQLNISNVEALRFYARYADVAVLARELNLDQVAAIHRSIAAEGICGPSGQPVRIEMFLPRRPLHGRERQVLPQSRQSGPLGQPAASVCRYAGAPTPSATATRASSWTSRVNI